MAKKILIKKKKYEALLDISLQQSTIIAASNAQLSRLVSEINTRRQQHAATMFEFDFTKGVIKTLQQEYQKLQADNTKLTAELNACQAKLVKVPVKETTDSIKTSNEKQLSNTNLVSPAGYSDEPYVKRSVVPPPASE